MAAVPFAGRHPILSAFGILVMLVVALAAALLSGSGPQDGGSVKQ